MKKIIRLSVFLAALTLSAAPPPAAAADFITVASTTSTRDSGLFDFILPIFSEATGIQVRIVAVGTGQAIRLARGGDADVLLVHHRKSEDAFVADGQGIERYDVMSNDFVIVGPAADPAGIKGIRDAVTALSKVAAAKARFLSRGDDSGTNKKELNLWEMAGTDVVKASGSWYRETGSGMGATLNAAAAGGGYTLTDRGTWLAFMNKGDLAIMVEGDPRILNPYGVIAVNPAKHPNVKAALAQKFIDWLVSKSGQDAIAAFRVNGEQLFIPNAK